MHTQINISTKIKGKKMGFFSPETETQEGVFKRTSIVYWQVSDLGGRFFHEHENEGFQK